MKPKVLVLLFVFLFSANSSIFSSPGKDTKLNMNVVLFQGAPNPCNNKCLIRAYLPENDPYSSIRILNADSSLVREISMATETGISSAAFDVSDLQNGNYIYQLFYRGETRYT